MLAAVVAGSDAQARFNLASGLVATSLLGFLIAVLTRRFYDGTLHDPNGMRPVKIRTRRGVVEVDINMPIVVTALVVLAGAVLVFWRNG